MIKFFQVMNELLLPAGTKESFFTAISNGANAIYLGIDKFNARAYAANFTLDELGELVNFAHLRNVKINVTMNTMLYDEELEEAFKTIDKLASLKVDAIIVQDLTLLNYIVKNYKSLEAHTSTQMGIDDFYGAKLMKEIGATRIVFARETPLDVIKNVKEKLNIEVEIFVHGALCVAYSGNCLISSMIGGRSGNRGRCAGCCRQIYSLIDENNKSTIKTGYLLSMKDLNLSSYLKDLMFADSFKVEGRMKEPTYVGGVGGTYREIIDNNKINLDNLNKVFNRTYTKGFMLGETSDNITNIEKPNNYGYEIGKVVKINKDTIWIKLFKELSKGDQIRIENKNSFKEISLPITKLLDPNFKPIEKSNKTVVISCHEKVLLNAKVYKTKDINFINEIEELSKNKEYNKLPISMKFYAKLNQNPSLVIKYDNIKIGVNSSFLIEEAKSSKVTKENVFTQLNKLNDTPYKIKECDIFLDDNVFMPLKEINELRRKGIEELNKKRLDKYELVKIEEDNLNFIKHLKVKNHDLLVKKELAVEVFNEEQFEVAKELGIKHIYFKNKISRNNEKYLKEDYLINNEINELLIGGYGAIERYKDNKNIKLITDYSFNVSNYLDVALLSSMNVERITLSSEINKEHLNEIAQRYFEEFNTYPNLELIVYGRAKLMHSKYCVLKRLDMCGKCRTNKYSLKDRFEKFPLTFNDDCTMNVLNSKTLNLMDEVDKLKYINYFRLVFTTETKEETRNIIQSFKDIIENNMSIKTFDKEKDTRGNFIKNAL